MTLSIKKADLLPDLALTLPQVAGWVGVNLPRAPQLTHTQSP
jgi:hypothetical protein